ncbi:hypothetical protein LJ739_16820 [Aestuariibacter halophilus]|uniref:Uncharacterized protein n=1 Tax=Fluctibacter halophilus TaxID=226011 RepID=A0ABS8GBP4_9ALTE|nr:hypothetical protein [Aestuariibacter halophilus]MCC2617918.1 hypothetical protein [Aestuariibacter halophilus]
MEIGGITAFPTVTVNTGTARQAEPSDSSPNAFGIGRANQPEVQLSPQARILQQNEQNDSARREALGQDRSQQDSQPSQDVAGNDYVRVSSSVGSAQRNNLTTEQATEVYRSIQDLL